MGSDDGANLAGLVGGDSHCQRLAEAAGAGAETWRVYLSSGSENARDRIDSGSWYNAKGELIAQDVDALHSDADNVDRQTGLTESGAMVNGRGDDSNMHDILGQAGPLLRQD